MLAALLRPISYYIPRPTKQLVKEVESIPSESSSIETAKEASAASAEAVIESADETDVSTTNKNAAMKKSSCGLVSHLL